MSVLRELAADLIEAALPGDAKPKGFSGAGRRAGGPLTLDWYVVFVNNAGEYVAGGTATIQWYGVEIAGATITTPVVGEATEAGPLVVRQVTVGEAIWPWPLVTATDPPVTATKLHIYATPSTLQPVALDALGTQDAAEAAIAAKVADSTLPSDADVAAVPAAVITALNTGAAVLSRVKASAAAAYSEALPTLEWFGAEFDGADLEIMVGEVDTDAHVEVWGLLVTGGAAATSVSVRSGTTPNDASSTPIRDMANTADATILHRIGAGASFICPPGPRPLWRAANGMNLIVKKEDASATCHVQVFYRVVYN